MRPKFLAKIGHILWGGFGLLLALLILLGGISIWSLSQVNKSSSRVIHDIGALGEKVNDINQEANSSASEVQKLSQQVQSGLAKKMQDGAADLQLLNRSVRKLVENTGGIIEQLETVLDDDQLDEETANVIEDLVFDAEDNYDMARKESMPIVQAAVARLQGAVLEADHTAK